MENKINRWSVLIAGVCANLCIGAAYAWSVFSKPIAGVFSASPSQAALVFSIVNVSMPISMLIAGKIQDKHGPRLIFRIAGVMFGLGYIISSFATSIEFLYISYGLIGGICNGAVYSCTAVNTAKFFPDKRGLAGGLISAGLGLSSVIIAPIAAKIIQQSGPLYTFRILGIVFIVVILIASLFIKAAPTGYRPEGWTPPAVAANKKKSSLVSGVELTWKDMLKEPLFYIAWVMLLIAGIAGLMIIGHASAIGQEIFGLTPAIAAISVSILGLSNTLGRVFWGWASDKLGRFRALQVMLVMFALGLGVLATIASTFAGFLACLMLIGSSYGGFFGVYPSVTGDMFGMKNMGMNWGIMFTAFAPASIIGPLLAARVKVLNNGDYGMAFAIAGGLSILGILLTSLALNILKKRSQANTKVQVETVN
ncbi:L-lactate MFS transporter [Youngiibacter multivorans]|uniref:OFA family oxalate/formate antiporter-like MFS transporter n=1 Tax=Youngiibacter multivorans TaxID=937251 RepID=A0ABS4G6U1_9CLOT|nr:OFA family MFS transporter [Youngiibacter multivorans]MBP1920268.1 OFA family oxalate/formate antiporter-like MFS transporter [Youngiibacter multivorans]